MKPFASPLAAALIAGGASSRFGSPKSDLEWKGSSLAAHLLGQMGKAGLKDLMYNASQAPRDLPAGVRLLPDVQAGQGPLGGLATLLQASACPVLVAACDMPGLDAEAFASLAAGWAPGMRGLVAKGEDGWHPLLGIYDPCLLPEIEERLKRGRRAMHSLVEDLGLGAWTPEPRWVVNVNTPEEWERWKAV
jgi:molybdopterin-guanine dinucleotide biosynthesis protein A